jgi:lysophospholipase L1-like esterase
MAKIVFLGDSLTWGGYGGNFVKSVAATLPEHHIINAGVAGDTIINLLRRLPDVLKDQPDYMFVMVGGNDAVSYIYPAVRPYYKSTKKLEEGMVAPEEFAAAYRELLLQIQLNFVVPLVGLAPTEYNAELVQARHIYNQLTRAAAEILNIPVLDLATPFIPAHPITREGVSLAFIQEIGERARTGWHDYEAERQRWGYTYTFDGMHLTPAAAEQFAQRISAFLREQVR